MINSPYEAYVMYLGIKRHFDPSNSYDYFKYNKKTNTSPDAFFRRNDAKIFQKFKNIKDLESFFVGNISINHKKWIGNFDRESWSEYIKRINSAGHMLSSTIKDHINRVRTFDRVFQPDISKCSGYGLIDIAILNTITDGRLIQYWDNRIYDPLLWPDIRHKIISLKPFIIGKIERQLPKYRADVLSALIE